MMEKADLSEFSAKDNFSQKPDTKQQNEIVWQESNDVYKPISKSIRTFIAERRIRYQLGRVYIKEDALYHLIAHLETNLRTEQGGILFGNAYEDPQTQIIYVEITAAIAAPATIGTGSHLEFTSESWLGIMDYAKDKYPQENIVGWYHSHPNIGVFMSGTDMKTQRAFFYHPWCLSIVCDPVREEIGYFLGAKAATFQPVIFKEKYHPKPNSKELNMKTDEEDSSLFFFDPSLFFVFSGLVILIIILAKILSLIL